MQDEEGAPNFGLIRPRLASPTRRSDGVTPAPAAHHRDGGIRRRPLSFDDGHVRLGPAYKEVEQDDVISGALNQAIPDQSKTPNSNGTKLTPLQPDLRADCDRGVAAQRRLAGTHVAWPASQRIACIIMPPILITHFAPALYEWPTKGNKHQTLTKLAGTYAVQRSSIVAQLTSATAIGGEKARDFIDRAKQAVFGSEAIHDIAGAIYGLQCFYSATHADSKKQEIIDNATNNYLRTADSEIDSLLSASSRG